MSAPFPTDANYREARNLAGCIEDDDDCATHEPCAWPCRSQVVERIAKALAAAEQRGRVAALREAEDWLYDLPWEPGQARRGPARDEMEWVRGASDGVEWCCDRLRDRADAEGGRDDD